MLLKKFSKMFPDSEGRKRRMKVEVRPLGEVAEELKELLQQMDFTNEPDVMESLSKLSDSAMDYLVSYYEELDTDGTLSESSTVEALEGVDDDLLAALGEMLQTNDQNTAITSMKFRKVDDEVILPFEATEPEGELDASYEKMPDPVDGSFSDEDADNLIDRIFGL